MEEIPLFYWQLTSQMSGIIIITRTTITDRRVRRAHRKSHPYAYNGAHGAPYEKYTLKDITLAEAQRTQRFFIFVFSGIKNLILCLRALLLCEINANP